MLDFATQQQVDRLSGIIGSESNVRDQLGEIIAEIKSLRTALFPLEEKQTELLDRLVQIEQAKVDTVALKAPFARELLQGAESE